MSEFGERCWEVDILPPAAIRAALDAHIASWLDWKTCDGGKLRSSAPAVYSSRAFLGLTGKPSAAPEGESLPS
jgi:hypothetical protein